MKNRDEDLYLKSQYQVGLDIAFLKMMYGIEIDSVFPKEMLRKAAPELPEVSEVDVIRHYTKLSQQNYGVDSGFYPLGSCTMKYNPKINKDIASMDGFAQMHPLQNQSALREAWKYYTKWISIFQRYLVWKR